MAPGGCREEPEAPVGTSELLCSLASLAPLMRHAPHPPRPVSAGSGSHAFWEAFLGLCAGSCSTLRRENPV